MNGEGFHTVRSEKVILILFVVQEGDQVSRFQKICEIQSDKASMDITSPYEGRVRQVHYSSGDVVKVSARSLRPSDSYELDSYCFSTAQTENQFQN